jgi:predicted RNA binding protein YcfA (HicA-like mRNA interferase family)
MTRIVPTDWKALIKVFELYGCRYKRKEGSHHVLSFPGAKRAVVIPEYDEINVEIIRNNMRTVNMSREEYFELLKKV